MNKGKLVRASHGACAALRPPQRLGSCLLTQRRGVRRREEALQSMCLLPPAPSSHHSRSLIVALQPPSVIRWWGVMVLRGLGEVTVRAMGGWLGLVT